MNIWGTINANIMKNEIIGILDRDFFNLFLTVTVLRQYDVTVPICEIDFINVYEAVTHSSNKCCRNAYKEINVSFSRAGFQS